MPFQDSEFAEIRGVTSLRGGPCFMVRPKMAADNTAQFWKLDFKHEVEMFIYQDHKDTPDVAIDYWRTLPIILKGSSGNCESN